MTATIILKKDKIYEPNRKIYKKFLKEINQTLPDYITEYSNIVEKMDQNVLSYLYATINFWENFVPMEYKKKFRITKIIECFSFWKGYLEAGGKLTHSSNHNLFKIDSNKEIIKEKESKYSVVIPIGSLSIDIKKIMQKSLSTLSANQQISKIICVYDYKIKVPDFINNFKKASLLETDKPGPAFARNLGINEVLDSGAQHIILMDSDILLESNSLAQLIEEYEKSRYSIGCPKIIAKGNSWFDYYYDFNGTLNGRYLSKEKNELLFGTTSIMCVSSKVFEEGLLFLEDFNEAAGEDIDFCLRAISMGYRIYPIDKVSIKHWYGVSKTELSEYKIFSRRFERYGRGEYKLLQKHPYYHSLLERSNFRQSI